MEARLGKRWYSEYVGFCLGINFRTAGALEMQYRLGRAHAEFEELRGTRVPTKQRWAHTVKRP